MPLSKLKSYGQKPIVNLLKLLLVFAATILVCYAGVRIANLLIPFVLALLCAMVIDPLVRLLTKIRIGEWRLPRSIATIISMLFVGGIVGVGFFFLIGAIINQLIGLAQDIPRWLPGVVADIKQTLENLDSGIRLLPYDIPDDLLNRVYSGLYSLAGEITKLVNSLAKGVVNTAGLLPDIFLFLVMWLVGTFYMSSWRKRIVAFMHRELPDEWMAKVGTVKKRMFSTLFGYIRAQLMMMCMVFAIVLIGLYILKSPYALLLALVIALFDALPLLGSGLILNTWAVSTLVLTGNWQTALGLFLIWVAVAVGRNMMEPRLVGGQIGLPPLLTMMAMYAGFRLLGFIGMIVGPVMMVIFSIVYEFYAQGRTLRQILYGEAPPESVTGPDKEETETEIK